MMITRTVTLAGRVGGFLAILAAVIGLVYSLFVSRSTQAETVHWVLPVLIIGFIAGIVAWSVADSFTLKDRIREARHKVLHDKSPDPQTSEQQAVRTYLTTFPRGGRARPVILPWPMKMLAAGWYVIGLGLSGLLGAIAGFKAGVWLFDPSLLRLIPIIPLLLLAAFIYQLIFRAIKPADLQQRWATIDEEDT